MMMESVPLTDGQIDFSVLEERQLKRVKKAKRDGYRQRRAEGRPQHGQCSRSILIIGVLTQLGNALSLLAPWRATWVGIFGYMNTRTWGLLWVSGTRRQPWHQFHMDTCSYYTDLGIAHMCFSPICIWYRIKCITYYQFLLLSYGCALGIFTLMVLELLCLRWTVRLSPKTIKMAMVVWPFLFAWHLLIVLAWCLSSEMFFEDLNMKSYYPTPGLSLCIAFPWLTCSGLFTNSILARVLHNMWPEVDDSSSDSEDEDDLEEEEDQLRLEEMQRMLLGGAGGYDMSGMQMQDGMQMQGDYDMSGMQMQDGMQMQGDYDMSGMQMQDGMQMQGDYDMSGMQMQDGMQTQGDYGMSGMQMQDGMQTQGDYGMSGMQMQDGMQMQGGYMSGMQMQDAGPTLQQPSPVENYDAPTMPLETNHLL